MRLRLFLVAGLLACGPLTAAFAQGGTSPDLKADSSSEANSVKRGAATNPHKPGATGSTVVPGNNSTVAGDRAATGKAQSGSGGGGGGGK